MSYIIKYHEPECRMGTNCQDKDCGGYHYARWTVERNDNVLRTYTTLEEAEKMCKALNND